MTFDDDADDDVGACSGDVTTEEFVFDRCVCDVKKLCSVGVLESWVIFDTVLPASIVFEFDNGVPAPPNVRTVEPKLLLLFQV